MPTLKDLKNGSSLHGTNNKQIFMKKYLKNCLLTVWKYKILLQYIYLVHPDSISHAALKPNILPFKHTLGCCSYPGD